MTESGEWKSQTAKTRTRSNRTPAEAKVRPVLARLGLLFCCAAVREGSATMSKEGGPFFQPRSCFNWQGMAELLLTRQMDERNVVALSACLKREGKGERERDRWALFRPFRRRPYPMMLNNMMMIIINIREKSFSSLLMLSGRQRRG